MRVKIGEIRITDKIKKAVLNVLDTSTITENGETYLFEKRLGELLKKKYCVAFNSGTSALISALSSLNLEKPVVLTTPLTYISTVHAIVLSDYYPVFVDVSMDDFCIDIEQAKEALEKISIGCFLPVDLFGYRARIEEVKPICDKKKIYIVEDAAQALGSKDVGKFADIVTFSFFIAHTLQAGELGAFVTDSKKMRDYGRKIKSYGRACSCEKCKRKEGKCPYKEEEKRFDFDIVGYNFKTTDIITAIANEQLSELEYNIQRRRDNVKYLTEHLEKVSWIDVPSFKEDVSYMVYPIVCKSETIRNKLRMHLERVGIETRPFFRCIPTQIKAYAHHFHKKYANKLPNAEILSKHGFYIGCHQYLSQEDLDYIIKKIKEWSLV